MLTKEQGYELLRSILTHWTIKESVLENEVDILDDFLSQNGSYLYDHAVAWDGGTSLEEKNRWFKLYQHSWNMLGYDNELIDGYDLIAIAKLILEVTQDIIIPVIDINKKLPEFKIEVKREVIMTNYYTCSNCKFVNKIHSTRVGSKHTCQRCKIIGVLK